MLSRILDYEGVDSQKGLALASYQYLVHATLGLGAQDKPTPVFQPAPARMTTYICNPIGQVVQANTDAVTYTYN